jgi:hypothetical protein
MAVGWDTYARPSNGWINFIQIAIIIYFALFTKKLNCKAYNNQWLFFKTLLANKYPSAISSLK